MTNLWMPKGQTIKLGHRGSPTPPRSPRTDRPRLIGDGPSESSTSHTLDRQPFCWDCNGFYRRLGLAPGVPRIECARAFLELEGYKSSYLTNAARVLTNKDTKRRYDALPLGTFWPDDEALVAAIIDGEMVAVRDTEWSFYILGDIDPERIDRNDMSMWRTMIGLLLWRAGVPLRRFALGVAEEPSAAIVGYRIVCFLPLTSKPAWPYAAAIASGIIELLRSPR